MVSFCYACYLVIFSSFLKNTTVFYLPQYNVLNRNLTDSGEEMLLSFLTLLLYNPKKLLNQNYPVTVRLMFSFLVSDHILLSEILKILFTDIIDNGSD